VSIGRMTPNNLQRIPAFFAHIDSLLDVVYRNVMINDKGFTPNTSQRIRFWSTFGDVACLFVTRQQFLHTKTFFLLTKRGEHVAAVKESQPVHNPSF
jgi:hypothetical protein